jgi:cysteine-rich repeat protein
VAQAGLGEECDDGNNITGDGCTPECVLEYCGDGLINNNMSQRTVAAHLAKPLEECDDGNTVNGDGCDWDCQREICGNKVVQSGEECDDGNRIKFVIDAPTRT